MYKMHTFILYPKSINYTLYPRHLIGMFGDLIWNLISSAIINP